MGEIVSPVSTPTLVTVTVRYFAGAKAAAGTTCEALDVPTDGATVAGVLAVVVASHGGPDGPLAAVLAASSYLLDGLAVHSPDEPVPHGAALDVLPPFAGG